MKTDYDIVIVGGGMVGSAIACALGGSRYRIAVIEGQYPDAYETGQPHDLRVSALSVASETLLRNIGAWDGVLSRRACPYRRMKVWESHESAATLFDSEQIGEAYLGHIVENRITQLALLETLKQHENIDLICPAKTLNIDYSPGSSLVQLDDGRELLARLLIGADGGESRVRQAAGIGISKWDYDQQALVASVITDYPQQDITWQQFTATGPLAFLPLNGPHASLVWYNTPDEVKRLLALSDEAFLQALHQRFPACLGKISQLLERGAFPLRRQHAQRYIVEGVALAGDSAHMIHPLAGQGVNIGFMDAAMLAEVLLQAASENHDAFYSEEVLSRYQQARRSQNLLMMQTMDAFYRVFSTENPPLKLLRNLGLGLAERLPFAKPHVTRYAMGLEGPVPQLARRDG
ncbi:MAG: UbiH/UbiF/VisC/COQ6 family ubiquinone biosynthesis hydroxylase [Nitrincola lacisaponensis]|uniref:UbiH/UbiF/VisC/COQ6 family ubiquinone biosynthesis hydroxylase n=1 Tax=Nitrincola lacisaponensis TaxID=267850 RepID=UPI00391D2B3B